MLGSNLPAVPPRKMFDNRTTVLFLNLCQVFIEKRYVPTVVQRTGNAANSAVRRVRPPIEVRLKKQRKNYLR